MARAARKKYEPIGRSREGTLRLVAAVAALVAGGVHLVLAVADLIPGEPTRGPVFGLMGAGYLVSAPAILTRRSIWDGLVLLYTVGLILAYAVSRDELPVEAIGIATKTAELILAAVLALLMLSRDHDSARGG